jgi:hypothetical protein
MIKRLSMATVMCAGIFAPERGIKKIAAQPEIPRQNGSARFPFTASYYKIRCHSTHDSAMIVCRARGHLRMADRR